MALVDREHVFFESRLVLREWLVHHARTQGIWAVFYKKSTGLSDLSWEALVEECLCFGWIDSLPGKVDDEKTKIFISPRKTDSGWSRRNKVLLQELEALGKIQPPGFAAIERAKQNGSWLKFDLAEDRIVPPELQIEFDVSADLLAKWNSLSHAKQRQQLQLIYAAKTPQTRAKRIEELRAQLLSG